MTCRTIFTKREAEKAALTQGVIKPDDEISVLPPGEAQE